jgi:hypothetical protein
VADVTAWQAVETDAGHHTYLYIIAIVALAILSLILALLLFLTLASVRRHVQLADRELHGRPIIREETVFAGDDPISDPPTTQRELYLEFFRGSTPLYWLVTIIPSWLLPRYEPPTPFLLRNYHK